MSKETGKRGRSANYTQQEKALLIDLVMKYKNIVDDKRTGGYFIKKKKEAWIEISKRYNSNCTSGRRETEQLKVLYDNMKQKARRNLGKSNVQMPTTGTNNKAQSTDTDTNMLADIKDQAKPLSNTYDSSAIYFKGVAQYDEANPKLEDIKLEEINKTDIAEYTDEAHQMLKDIKLEEMNRTAAYKNQVALATNFCIDVPLTSAAASTVAYKKKKCGKASPTINETSSAEDLKRLYYKKKYENATLECKSLMLGILHMKREHTLKMRILKNKLNKSDE